MNIYFILNRFKFGISKLSSPTFPVRPADSSVLQSHALSASNDPSSGILSCVFSPLYSSGKRFLNICHVRCRERCRLLLFLVFLLLVFVFFNFRLVFPFLIFSYLILTLTKQKSLHHQLLSDCTVRALDQRVSAQVRRRPCLVGSSQASVY